MAKKKTEQPMVTPDVTVKKQKGVKLTVKITPKGGYAMGKGACPFDPDMFMKLFGDKVIEAQAQGTKEIVLDQDMVDQAIAAKKVKWHQMIDEAQTKEVLYTGDMQKVLEA